MFLNLDRQVLEIHVLDAFVVVVFHPLGVEGIVDADGFLPVLSCLRSSGIFPRVFLIRDAFIQPEICHHSPFSLGDPRRDGRW